MKHLTREITADKNKLFVFAGIAKNEGSGWDYAIPQAWFDKLLAMEIQHPSAWFVTDCTGTFPRLHHVGEAYAKILNDRSEENSDTFTKWFNINYENGTGEKPTARSKAFYEFFMGEEALRAEADAGLLNLSFIEAAFNAGWKARNSTN